MVIFLQLCIFLLAVIIRGRFLFGLHLRNGGHYNGLTFTVKTKYGISARHIGLIQENGIPFVVMQERWYHRLLKGIGIASEIKVSDTKFDKKHFITTDYPTHLEQALASGKLMESLKELFALPVKSLRATPHKIWCVIREDDFQESDGYYHQHTDLLTEIAKAGRAASTIENGPRSSRKLGSFALAFICVHAGLFTLGVLGTIPTLADSIEMIDKHGLLNKGAFFGIVAAGIWLLGILAVFRGSSWVGWVVVDFIMCGIVGFILSGMVFVREANIHWFQPPAQIFDQPITQKICTLKCKKSCGRRCTEHRTYAFQSDAECVPQSRKNIMEEKVQTDAICASEAWFEYTIGVKHWHNTSDYHFEPSTTLFDSVQTGALLRVPVHEGALGLEWVDTDRIFAK